MLPKFLPRALFLGLFLTALLHLVRAQDLPKTGIAAKSTGVYDTVIPALMEKWKIPGAALAIVKDGKLTLARGYGWANREQQAAAYPDSLFRIAGVSQTLTATAILGLVQVGKLKLDDYVFNILEIPASLPGTTPDTRLADITVRQLLQNTGGWDKNASFDPFEQTAQIAKATGATNGDAILRFMASQPLQFDPGTRAVESDFGYFLLGRVIEKVSGQSYESFIQKAIWAPLLPKSLISIIPARRQRLCPPTPLFKSGDPTP